MKTILPMLAGASDEQMMWRVKMAGDSEAFARLVARWEKPLVNLCTRLTGDADRARDLVQVVFTRVFSGRGGWEPRSRFSTFVWRIAINLCHDETRRKNRLRECSLEDLTGEFATELADGQSASPDLEADARERGELVRRALMQLAEPYREVLVLRHYEGMKFAEIAAVLGIPEGTAKSRMAEGLTQLNRRLKHLTEELSCNRKNQTPELRVL